MQGLRRGKKSSVSFVASPMPGIMAIGYTRNCRFYLEAEPSFSAQLLGVRLTSVVLPSHRQEKGFC